MAIFVNFLLLTISSTVSLTQSIENENVTNEWSLDNFSDEFDEPIDLIERFQLGIKGRSRVLRQQEERWRREEQMRTGVKTRARTSCPLPKITCFRSKYRTMDGTCNNLVNPRLGATGECVPRMLPAEYADKISTPKISVTKMSLPNPRLLSLTLHSDPKPDSTSFTLMTMLYGQFLDHDISFSPTAQSENGDDIKCCTSETSSSGRGRGSQRGFSSRQGSFSRWCQPITISANDPFFSRFGEKCMEFVRSAACLSCTWGPRYQINEVTSFIDASMVYGADLNESTALRSSDGISKLKIGLDINRRGVMLPRSEDPEEDGCSRPKSRVFCFAAGDVRVNQQAPLSAVHTIFVRHHNRLAVALKRLNRHWDEEKVFQEVRRIIGAQIQVITYKEWLPVVLGPTMMEHYRLNILPSGFTEYDPTLDSSIVSEFNTAAFRFGHSLIRGTFARATENGVIIPYQLRDNFFKPFHLRQGSIDSFVRGLLAVPASAFTSGVDFDLRNHLYQTDKSSFGGDLVAINIQRGRDHAIPGYVTMLKHCYSVEITEWAQLDKYMPTSQRVKYQSVYAHPLDIDLFSGGLSEYSLPNAIVGPVFACIIGNQFRNLRFGDRYWFEHSNQDGSFTEAQVNSLRRTNFAKIICDNGDAFAAIHPQVFLPVSPANPVINCSSLADIDLSLWADSPTFTIPYLSTLFG